MRTFLSTDHPEYSLRSYVWAGQNLIEHGAMLPGLDLSAFQEAPA